MDFVNKTFSQVADLFRSMTPGARLTAGLLLAAVVVSLGYLFTHQLSGGDAYLLGGQPFSAHELPAMEAAFGKAGLGNYTVEGNRIRIPRGQQAAYMGALADAGALPADFHKYLTDATANVGPFTSRPQQEEMIKIARQKELALIIRSMQGIENAAVHYDTQKKGGLNKGTVTTASVSVKPRGSQPLDERQVPMIRHLVAGAVAGLLPEQVTVVDLNGRTFSGGKSDGIGGAFDDPHLARMREYQATFESMILNALSYVPGVTVTASVELNKELHHRQEKDTYDPKAVAVLSQREETSTSTSNSGGSGGQPGLESQGPNRPGRLTSASSGSKSEEERSTTEITNAPSRERTLIDLAALTPKRVAAAVGVPSSYFESIWKQRNPAPAGQPPKTPDRAALDQIQKEEIEKIREHVTRILQPHTAAPDAAAAPLVTVTAFSQVPPSALPEPPTLDKALHWFSASWSTLGMILLAGTGLVMLRSLTRPSATDAAAAPLPASPEIAAAAEPEPGDESPPKPKGRLKRKLGGGPSLREELAEIVREDPDAAANILRGWIGNAS